MIRRVAALPFACALLLASAVALARAPVVPPTASELRAIVETLTAPEMDGRRAGTAGGERATERLAAWFGAAGLRPAGDSGTFLQSFRVASGRRLGPASALEIGGRALAPGVDRKSTRLNSSHDQISYAVFCLKKKKNSDADTLEFHTTPLVRCKTTLQCQQR